MKENDIKYEWLKKAADVLDENDKKMKLIYDRAGIKKQDYKREKK